MGKQYWNESQRNRKWRRGFDSPDSWQRKVASSCERCNKLPVRWNLGNLWHSWRTLASQHEICSMEFVSCDHKVLTVVRTNNTMACNLLLTYLRVKELCNKITVFSLVSLRCTPYSMKQSPSWEAKPVFSQTRNSPHFTEPEGSLPDSQVLATCPYPEPVRSSPYSHIPLPEDPVLKVILLIIVYACTLLFYPYKTS